MLKTVTTAMLALTIAIPAWAGVIEDNALRDGARHLDVEKVKTALKNGANPNTPKPRRDRARVTPLGFVAHANIFGLRNPSPEARQAGFMDATVANSKSVEIAKVLFGAGVKLGPDDQSILYYPISSGNVELVALLINKGASVTADLEGYTPTELARNSDQEGVYKLLVSRGGMPVDGRRAAQLCFVEAAESGDFKPLLQEFENGAKVDDFDSGNETALSAALRFPVEPERVEMISWLLDHGADANRKGREGTPPLHIFIKSNGWLLDGKNGPYLKELVEFDIGSPAQGWS